MFTQKIVFDKTEYPLRTIPIGKQKLQIVIATDMLDDALFDLETMTFRSESAQEIDSHIFYYVDEEQFNLCDRQLLEYLTEVFNS
jgi:hypothetical protein